MLLIRYHEHFRFEPHEGAYFWMADGTIPILCKVSHEALRVRSVRDGANATLPDTFRRHRERIEADRWTKLRPPAPAQRHRPGPDQGSRAAADVSAAPTSILGSSAKSSTAPDA